MSETLKPCPFCGGEAEAITGPVPCWWGVRCKDCDVWRDDRAATKAEAISAWNRRAPAYPDGTLLRVVGGKVERVEADVVGALHHALGLIVEFGDLNGFRNLTDEELGKAVLGVGHELHAVITALEGK